MTTANDYVRVNLTIPRTVLNEVKNMDEKMNISKFTSEALIEKVARERRARAVEEIRKSPPGFPDITDAAKYVRDMREENEERMKRAGL